MTNFDTSIEDYLMYNDKCSVRLYNVITSMYDKTTPLSIIIDQYKTEGIMSFRFNRNMGRKTLNELNVILSEITGSPMGELKVEGVRERVKRETKDLLEKKFKSETLRLMELVMNGIDSNQTDINLVVKELGYLNTGLKNCEK